VSIPLELILIKHPASTLTLQSLFVGIFARYFALIEIVGIPLFTFTLTFSSIAEISGYPVRSIKLTVSNREKLAKLQRPGEKTFI
jgi:hypothetical protein